MHSSLVLALTSFFLLTSASNPAFNRRDVDTSPCTPGSRFLCCDAIRRTNDEDIKDLLRQNGIDPDMTKLSEFTGVGCVASNPTQAQCHYRVPACCASVDLEIGHLTLTCDRAY